MENPYGADAFARFGNRIVILASRENPIVKSCPWARKFTAAWEVAWGEIAREEKCTKCGQHTVCITNSFPEFARVDDEQEARKKFDEMCEMWLRDGTADTPGGYEPTS